MESHPSPAGSPAADLRLLEQASLLLERTDADSPAALGAVARLLVPSVADVCTLYVAGEDGTMRVVADAAADAELALQVARLRELPLTPDGLAARVLRTGRSELHPVLATALAPRVPEPGLALQARAGAVVPLRAGDQILGVLAIGLVYDRPSPEPRVLIALEELGRRVGLAIRHARSLRGARRALDESRSSAARLRTLLDLTADLAQALTVADVCRVALQRGLQAAGAYAGAVLRLAGDRLETIAARNYPPAITEPHHIVPLDSGAPVAAVLRRRLPFLATNRGEDAAFEWAERTQTNACLPLRLHGRDIGCLALSFEQRRVFTSADVDLLRALADQCALALERAFLHDEVERSRAVLETGVRYLPSGMLVLDADGRTLLANDEARRLVGPVHDELPPLQARAMFTASGAPLAPERGPVPRSLRDGEVVKGEQVSLTLPDGQMRHLRVSSAPVRGADGAITAAVVSLEDVSRERRAEHAQALLADAGVLLSSTLDPEVMLNRLARRLVPQFADWCAVEMAQDAELRRVATAHVDPARLLRGEELRRLWPPEARGGSALFEVLRTGRSVLVPVVSEQALAQSIRDPARVAALGELGMRSMLLAPITVQGQAVGVLQLVQAESARRFDESDVTVAEELGRRAGMALQQARLIAEAERSRSVAERARAEAERAGLELRETNQKLQEAVAVREDFLSIAGHELRTPLTALQLQLGLLRRTLPEGLPKLDEGLRRGLQHGERLGRLVDELLDVGRIVAGRLELHREPTDLADVVRELADRLGEHAARAGCALELHTEAVRGDWDRLRVEQVVSNLLWNAFKYGRGKPVRVHVGPTERGGLFEVVDQGIGIPKEDQARIFQRFERAAPRNFGGLGLGLWISRQIVEAHGGSIRVRSEPGRGATFGVELPV